MLMALDTGGSDEFDKAFEPARPGDPLALPTGNVLAITWLHDIEAALEANDFVEGLLTEGGMSVIYGESNVGKTFFATDLALHVATGRPWRGRTVDQRGVLYLAMEGGHGIRNRVAAYKAAFAATHGIEGQKIPFAIASVPVNFLDPMAGAPDVLATLQHASDLSGIKFGMVVGDTLSRALSGGNENASEDMGALVTNGDRIRSTFGAHFMWIHHAGKDAAKGARGHSLLRAATDTEIEVTRDSPDSPPVASVKKQRDLPCEGRFAFSLRVVELGENARGKVVTSCVVEPTEETGEAVAAPKLKPSAKACFRALLDSMAEFSQPLPPSWQMPQHIRAVKEDIWRDRFNSTGMPGATADAKRMAWNRGIKDLRELGIVAARQGLAWPTDQARDACG